MTTRLTTPRRQGGAAFLIVLLAGVIPAAAALADTADLRSGINRVIARAAATAPRFSPAPPTRPEEFTDVRDVRPVHFDVDKAEIRAADAAVVATDARWLRANPTDEILIEGYADGRGTKQYNLALAERRARSLRDQLVARGIEPDRIVLASYGVGRPVCTEKTDACWSRNRRADILVRVLRVQSP